MEFYKEKPTLDALLKHVYQVIDSQRGFHYQHVADASWESLQQVIKDEVSTLQ
jgi:hypothetical protein